MVLKFKEMLEDAFENGKSVEVHIEYDGVVAMRSCGVLENVDVMDGYVIDFGSMTLNLPALESVEYDEDGYYHISINSLDLYIYFH